VLEWLLKWLALNLKMGFEARGVRKVIYVVSFNLKNGIWS
jgi:hypothetical protein